MKIEEPSHPLEVVVTRGGIAESVHDVHVAVVDDQGEVVAWAGDPSLVVYYRSSAKPLQALPLVEDGVASRFSFEARELALASASHGGEPLHVEVARGMLTKISLGEDALACGPHPPLHPPEAERLLSLGLEPGRAHNNCSGKHAGMLALARAHGWPVEGYHRREHPVQQRMLAEVSRWSEMSREDIVMGVDGCGVVCFAVPLQRMAYSFARFSRAASRGEGPGRIVEAMTGHAFMVGGTSRLCTDLMVRAGGRAFVKYGAEGVYCGGVPEGGLGLALKAVDGGRRAAEAGLVFVLGALGVLDAEDQAALSSYGRPPVHNTRGEVVGEVTARGQLRGISH